MINQERDMDQNVSQEKSWQQIYWEEQNRKKEAEEKNKKQAVGLTVLIIGVVLVLAGVTWSAMKGGGLFGVEARDVRRAERSGQRAYTYMTRLAWEYWYDSENNMEYRCVIDQYGYISIICFSKADEKKYMYYQSAKDPEEKRLDGYAIAFGEAEKEMMRNELINSYGYTADEITDEMLEAVYGKYYLKVDENSANQVMWAWLLVAGGIVLTVVGGIIYFGRFCRS